MTQGIPPKSERMAEILRRLEAAPAAADAASARKLIKDTIDRVEDELTGLPYLLDPAKPPDKNDPRMYAPLDDNRHDVPDRPDVVRFRSTRHNTYVASNGAFEIQELDKTVVCRKPGKDGRHVFNP